MLDLVEAGIADQCALGRQVVVTAVAAAGEAFLIVAARIGAEQHAARLKRRMQRRQPNGHAWAIVAPQTYGDTQALETDTDAQ